MKRLPSFLLRNLIAVATLMIVTCMVAVLIVQAWLNTGRLVHFASTETFVFQMPDGTAQPIMLPANSGISVVGKDADHVQARIWMKKIGYVFSHETFARKIGETTTSH